MEASDVAGNRAAQNEEAEVLKSIYGEDCVIHHDNSCEIVVHPHEEDKYLPLRLYAYFPESYPSTSEPILEIEAPWLQQEIRQKLGTELHRIFEENIGSVIMFIWIEWMKEQTWLWNEAKAWSFLHGDFQNAKVEENVKEGEPDPKKEASFINLPCGSVKVKNEDVAAELNTKDLDELDRILGIMHGAPFTEKRSTFQAHLASVKSVDQVETVMEALLQNRKIAGATHNIIAYRIRVPEKATVLQDYDDDGETAAGGRLLHLLQIVDAIDVVVIVSRWFGGILLGPDRFKHINNVARSLLSECGYIKGAGQSGSLPEKQKQPQSKAAAQKGKRR